MVSLAVKGNKLDDNIVYVSDEAILIGGNKLHSGTRSIIDTIIIWSSNTPILLLYLEFV